MKVASAELVPYSSVVGQSVLLVDENGALCCQLAIIGCAGDKERAQSIGQQIVEAFEAQRRLNAVVENLPILSTSQNR